MKISFYLKVKGQKLSDQEPFEVPYLYEGNLCSLIVYGSLSKPQILVESLEEKKQLPLTSKYWFFIRISWSRVDGFKFSQYTDPDTTTSLSSTTGSLKGGDKIELGNNLATIIFKAKINQEDLDTIEQTIFLEKCSEFGIRVVDTKFSNLNGVYGLSCANCQLVNVEFFDAQLEGVDFSNSYLNQVKFFNSNLNRANFTNSQLTQVEFSQCYLTEAIFDNCRTVYGKQRIENNEILIFNNCDLTDSSFKKALLCSNFEDCNLFNADFSLAKFVACKFYDCNLSNTIFSHSQFKAFGTQADKNKKPNDNNNELINCYIGVKPGFSSQEEKTYNATISKCKFDGALMDLIEISENTMIIESNFEATSLYKSKLRNCKFIQTNFTGKIMKSANLSSADISGSTFKNCCLNEVNLFRVKIIEAKFNNSELVRASFCNGNLRGSKFLNSDLTGVDFRYADLTLLNIDKCILNCANFFQTQRGGINLNISNEQNDKEKLLKTSCTISCIDWSPKRDGEIQISKEAFLDIIQGKQSAVAVITNLSKEGASYIFNTYANANAKSAENLNDSSVNTQGEVNDSSFDTGNIETDSNEEVEQDEDNTLENNETLSNDSSDEKNEEI